MDSLAWAIVLSIVGLSAAIAAICMGVWVAWRKPKLEEPLADGIYKIKCVGHDKLTGTPLYDAEEVEEKK